MTSGTGDGRRESDFSWRPMLLARPLRNAAAQADWNRDHTRFEITVPCRRPAYLVPPISWVVRPPKIRTMALDSIGVVVWEMCDGSRTVEAVIEAVARRHQLTFHESRVSVTAFLRSLVERGALVMIAAEGAQEAGFDEMRAKKQNDQAPREGFAS